MSMDFELKLDGKTMSRFLLHYNYTKATGLFGILLGIASLAAVFIKWNMWNANQRVVWIVIAVLFLIVQPLTLAKKGRRQMAQEEMQIPLFCHIDEEGISVTQGEASSSCKWCIGKMKCIYLRQQYMRQLLPEIPVRKNLMNWWHL